MKTHLYRGIVVLAGILVLLIGIPSMGQAGPPRQEPPPDFNELMIKAQSQGVVRIIVGLNVPFQPEGDTSALAVQTQRQSIMQAQDNLLKTLSVTRVTSVKNFSFIPYMGLEVDAAGLAALRANPEVTSIEEDIPVPPTLSSSTPIIGANTAWTMGYTGAGQTVAILDTGVESTHSFFGGRVVSEACYSHYTPASGIYALCPNGTTSQLGSGAANPNTPNCLNGSTNLCSHGTHVAGIAAGDGATFDGVARSANIIAIQIFSRFNNASDCSPNSAPCALTYSSDQILGLERVYALRATYSIAAVNMSLGGGYYTTPCDSAQSARKAAIDNLRSVGIVTIISSGNDYYTSGIGAPACISTAVSVGATNDSDSVASFSNSAYFLNLLAPGVSINSSIPGNSFANYNGTSMAAPHVTGAWAVFKSANPLASIDEILTILRDSGIPVTDGRNNITKPRLKIDTAIRPPNDDFNAAFTAAALYYKIQNATAATTAVNDPSFSCVSGQKYRSLWYKYTPSTNGTLAVNTFGSNYDTVLAVWTGIQGNLQVVDCDDDSNGTSQSQLEIPVLAGVTYYIEVASYDSGGGTLHLSFGNNSTFLPIIFK